MRAVAREGEADHAVHDIEGAGAQIEAGFPFKVKSEFCCKFAACLTLLLGVSGLSVAADTFNVTFKAKGQYEDVRDQVQAAMERLLLQRPVEALGNAVVICPYIVSVYTMPNDATVHVSYRKPGPTKNPALKKPLADVEKLLTEIVREGIQ